MDPFQYKGLYIYHLSLSDLDNKIKHRNHAKYLIQKISKVFMRSFRDDSEGEEHIFIHNAISASLALIETRIKSPVGRHLHIYHERL